MEDRPLKKEIKYTAIYYLIRFLILVSNRIPRRWWLAFCGFLGRVAYTFAKQSRRKAILHLTMAYGREKTTPEILTMSNRNAAGRGLGDRKIKPYAVRTACLRRRSAERQ